MTTPGDGSDFKGHLVHRPGRIEDNRGGKVVMSAGDWHPTDAMGRPLEPDFWHDMHEARMVQLDNLRAELQADQQTIADLRAETERWQEFANGYMRDLTAAEQTIAELRKALEAK